MTKEQIEQAANERFPDLAIDNDNTQAHKRYGFIAGATSPEAAAYHGQGWVSVEEQKEYGHTLGKLISGSMIRNHVSNVPDIPADIFTELKADNFWPNSVPIIAFRNMMRLLNLSLISVVPAIYETVKILEEKKKTESETNFRIDTRSDLWECKEAVDKYVKRLTELYLPSPPQTLWLSAIMASKL